ncbi:hypothetical protein ACFQZX_14895 [Mucilaginibacter litoreus]|uniref:DUF3828 domain-containing protein n=1 Tax=Mucilaginibacter litoreus TaxID=1048221 RepID=A0ABW3AV33_9SPHI
MKSTLNLFKPLLIFFAAITFFSCSTETGIWRKEQIKDGQRDELHNLTGKIFKAILTKDDRTFSNYLSKEMLSGYYYNKLSSQVYDQLMRDSLVLFDEFYVLNKYLNADTITVKNGNNSYKLIYNGDPQEMYIAMYLPKKKLPDQYLTTLVYGNFDYGWKLKDINVTPYKINSKTAPELYQQATDDYTRGNVFAAANTMQLARSCSRPNSYWQYDNETDLYNFAAKVSNEVNTTYHFPLKVEAVKSGPSIFRIYNNTYNEGTFPNVCYITKLSLTDTAALVKENKSIRGVINSLLPGIESGTPYIVYSAFNKMPSYSEAVPHYEFKIKLH